ncbi:MAG: 3-phosphoglycerate dehydrogenase [Gammaproteobacteria bacterium HGW-Gammaproteobacteria-10]|nr:MAG: 3-phosphoglycerate dehydrogenase [Gammaproteobacteria bacterium HGW-Gammaproteobacteria-10]
MYKIVTYNNISPVGLGKFPSANYLVAPQIDDPDAILLRSYNLHERPIPKSLKAVGRAGAGVNNIPVDDYSKRGIPVFNTPGANANAVAELTLGGMILASRNIPSALKFVSDLDGDEASIDVELEKCKKNFAGFEISGKTLGVLGLGAIGVKVANYADSLGLKVIGFDPFISLQSAWKLTSSAVPAFSLEDLVERSDFISLHVPLNDKTKNLFKKNHIDRMKKGSTLLNFSRAGIVDEVAVRVALDSGALHAYVSDFPTPALMKHSRVIALPHLGASTEEAEENCAAMVVDQIREFLEHGAIRNSVNFPDVSLTRSEEGVRLAIANQNIPGVVGLISSVLGDAGLNILNMINKSRGDFAYTLIDIDNDAPPEILDRLSTTDGIVSVRVI